MKKFLFLLLSAMFFSLFADNPDLLFEANYDTYSQHADFAKGDKKAYGFPENDLQLRMFPGIPGKSARNSLQVADTERVERKYQRRSGESCQSLRLSALSPCDHSRCFGARRVFPR